MMIYLYSQVYKPPGIIADVIWKIYHNYYLKENIAFVMNDMAANIVIWMHILNTCIIRGWPALLLSYIYFLPKEVGSDAAEHKLPIYMSEA